MQDNSVLKFGKAHYGKFLVNVPADYLLWVYDEFKKAKNLTAYNQELKEYIEENLDVLKKEAARNKPLFNGRQ